MPTDRPRITLTLDERIAAIFGRASEHTGMPVATLASKLLESHGWELDQYNKWLAQQELGSARRRFGLTLLQDYGSEKLTDAIREIDPRHEFDDPNTWKEARDETADARSDQNTELPRPRARIRFSDTAKLVRSLQEAGMPNDQFKRIHHFRARASLGSHLRYCEERPGSSYMADGTNGRVHRRMEYILRHKKSERPSPAEWESLVDQALAELPLDA